MKYNSNQKKLIKIIIFTLVMQVFLFAFNTIVNLWVSHGASPFYEELKTLMNYSVPLGAVLAISVIIFLVVAVMVYYHNQVIERYEDEKKDSERAIIRSFKELNEYQVQNELYDFMKQFTRSNSYIWAIQLYNFDTKFYKVNRRTVTRVNHIQGYVYEDINLNALQQHYYYYDADLYKEFSLAQSQLEQYNINEMLRFMAKYRGKLANKSSYSFHDAIIYAFLRLSIELLRSYGFVGPHTANLLNAEQRNELQNLERTGILRGIQFSKSFYTFEHLGDGLKKGRIYMTKRVKIKNIDHLFLITINPDILQDGQQLKSLAADFKQGIIENEILHPWIDLGYNEFDDYRIEGIWGDKL